MSDESITTAQAAQVAGIIKKQIGWVSLATVGASDFLIATREGGGLVFTARLHLTGQTRVRRMRVEVILNGRDEYDITVSHPETTKHPLGQNRYVRQTTWTEAKKVEGIYAEQLSGVIRDLDKGV